jgi:circadian clock protein KaiB
MSRKSTAAIQAVRELCEEHLSGRYRLEIIDLYQHPELAREREVLAAPTLVKELPEPLRRLIGDMTDQQRLLIGLDLEKGE